MSRAQGDGAADRATAQQLVRRLESSIADHLTTADRAREEVEHARVQAERIVTEAEEQATVTARRRTSAILSAAQAEATRLIEAGSRRAENLTAMAARHREQDVATVLSALLPTAAASGLPERISSAPSDVGTP